MSKNYAVAIVGGGFSGLVCAEVLGSKFGGEKVLVLEKNDRVGKKILATGNGRGNITNLDLSPEKYHSQNGADISQLLEKYGNKSIIEYFEGLGIGFSTEEGKVFPSSFQANSILDGLRMKIEYLGVDVQTSREVKRIKKTAVGYILETDGRSFFADKVIFACGGKASKQYGTDGSAYALLQELGHSVTDLFPSLVQVKTDVSKIKGLKGLKQQAEIKAVCDGVKTPTFIGDILFTDYGISGNAVFYLSAYISNKNNATLSISFLPDKGKGEIASFIREKFKNLPYVEAEEVLTGIINKQIGKAIIKDCGVVAKNSRSADVIASKVKDFRLEYKGTLGFDNAQVTKGGIPFNEVSENTLESKKAKGLYIVGESLDVDGDCGGYNLQWAYTSARIACDGVLDGYENR
ncbi:MAG: aminoacetone oxidase family FAD-binding enzyme [Clostridiales bacterium]|nr:aminoacetone oxidase family FAD-binding enzyme [Clostridiales bacterium]